MADPASAGGVLSGDLGNILNLLSAAAALGTASMGLIDASKAFCGGPSNFGFKHIRHALEPFVIPAPPAPITGGPAAASAVAGDPASPAKRTAFDADKLWDTLQSNWINRVPKADQKAKAKALIHLGLLPATAHDLAKAAGVDGDKLNSFARNIADSKPPDAAEMNVLAQFDAVLSAVLDAGYERADQKYRNAAKVLATIVSAVLGVAGGWLVYGGGPSGSISAYFGSWHFWLSLLVGVSATPLAPIAKDLASALQTAVTAVRAGRR